MTCLSKTGPDTRKIGKKSADKSVNAPGSVAKAVQPIPTAAPGTISPIPSPEAGLSLPSPTLTTNQKTVTPTTSELCVSGVISPMTPSIMQQHENAEFALSVTTNSPRYSDGKTGKQKKLTRKQLQKVITDKPEDLLVCQVTAETYRPAMDSIKAVIAVYGSNSKFPLYGVINKQVAAKCQMNGINDANATRRQRIALLTMFEDVFDVHTRAIELGLDKERMEQWRREQLTKTALFHGLGSKDDRKMAAKAQRKAA